MEQIMFARHGDGSLDRQTAIGMYRLRHEVFHDRLGWDVNSDNGMEHDEFDEAGPVYILVRGNQNDVLGCWRLLPTTGPNMLKDTFSHLLEGNPIPRQADVWELSRLAVNVECGGRSRYGFSTIPILMMQKLYEFARRNEIVRYVTVTTVAIERLLCRTGVNISRLGSPVKIGHVMTLACAIEIDEITEFALFGIRAEHTSAAKPGLIL